MISSKAIDSLEQLDLFDPQQHTLGLDLGSKSIGCAVLSGERIVKAGVYLFETAEELNSTGNKLVSETAERARKRRIVGCWIAKRDEGATSATSQSVRGYQLMSWKRLCCTSPTALCGMSVLKQ